MAGLALFCAYWRASSGFLRLISGFGGGILCRLS